MIMIYKITQDKKVLKVLKGFKRTTSIVDILHPL